MKIKNLNYKFINLYIEYLEKFTDEKFIKEFLEKNNKELKKFNNAIYKDNSKVDKINRIGLDILFMTTNIFIKDQNLLKKE